MNRREFARILAIGGAVPFVTPDLTWARGAAPKLPPTPASPDEKFWLSVREQFVMPKELTMLNAANLCPSSGPVLETLYKVTKDMDQDPSADNRAKLGDGRENTRKLLAEFLHVTPEEIVITRNTSESNNLVSTGIDLKPGDEVLLTADNHPSNHTAWQEKAKRFGFKVIDVPVPNPHPGFDHYVEAFTEDDHAADEGHLVHAPDEHGRRSVPREGDLQAGPRARHPHPGGRRPVVWLARRRLERHPAGLLQRQRAQVAVRSERERRAVHQQERAVEDLGEHLQRVSGPSRRLTDVRGIRPARRTGDDCVRRSAEAADDRSGARRSRSARAS